jgi:hypothetical protein
MTVLSPLSTSDAELVLAVANTHVFLARRLKENVEAQRLARTYTPQQILGALRDVVSRTPTSVSEVAEPFIYLAALCHVDDLRYLREVATIDAPHLKWFKESAQLLVEMTTPVNTISATFKPRIGGKTQSKSSNVSTSAVAIQPSETRTVATRTTTATQTIDFKH